MKEGGDWVDPDQDARQPRLQVVIGSELLNGQLVELVRPGGGGARPRLIESPNT